MNDVTINRQDLLSAEPLSISDLEAALPSLDAFLGRLAPQKPVVHREHPLATMLAPKIDFSSKKTEDDIELDPEIQQKLADLLAATPGASTPAEMPVSAEPTVNEYTAPVYMSAPEPVQNRIYLEMGGDKYMNQFGEIAQRDPDGNFTIIATTDPSNYPPRYDETRTTEELIEDLLYFITSPLRDGLKALANAGAWIIDKMQRYPATASVAAIGVIAAVAVSPIEKILSHIHLPQLNSKPAAVKMMQQAKVAAPVQSAATVAPPAIQISNPKADFVAADSNSTAQTQFAASAATRFSLLPPSLETDPAGLRQMSQRLANDTFASAIKAGELPATPKVEATPAIAAKANASASVASTAVLEVTVSGLHQREKAAGKVDGTFTLHQKLFRTGADVVVKNISWTPVRDTNGKAFYAATQFLRPKAA